MGSYCTTCFVSRQTISEGDPCMIVPIVQSASYSPVEMSIGDQTIRAHSHTRSTTSSLRYWTPLTSFLEVTCEDAGAVALADTQTNRLRLFEFLGYALKSLPVIHAGQSSCEAQVDVAAFMNDQAPDLLAYLQNSPPLRQQVARDFDQLFEQGLKCWTFLQDQIRQDRLFWYTHSEGARPLSVAIIHKAAYDELVSMTSETKLRDGGTMDMREHFDRVLQSALARRDEALGEKPQADGLTAEQIIENDEKFAGFARYAAQDEFTDGIRRTGAAQDFRSSLESRFIRMGVERLLNGQIDADKLFAAIRPWLEGQYACAGLERLNVHFEPLVYAGQDYSNSQGKAYSRFVDRVGRQVTRQNDLRTYGETYNYQFDVRDLRVAAEMARTAYEHDASWEVVMQDTDIMQPGRLLARVQCSMRPDKMLKMLQEFDNGSNEGRAIPGSLRHQPAGQDEYVPVEARSPRHQP